MKRRRPVNSHTKPGKGVVLGIDPDVNHTGLCVIKNGEIVHAALAEPRKNPRYRDPRLQMARALVQELDTIFEECTPDLVVIEWQAIRPSDPRPNDILELCSVGGMALALCVGWGVSVERPLPVNWKGSVEKRIHQQRIQRAVSPGDAFDEIPRGKRSHVIDALGLAIWGSQ